MLLPMRCVEHSESAVEVMARADTDGDGSVSFSEFKKLVGPLYDASGAALRKIFGLFDADGGCAPEPISLEP